jgi:hypothetical protein
MPPRLEAGDLFELGVDRELRRKGHLAIADHEQSDCKQREAAQHEYPDPRQSRW